MNRSTASPAAAGTSNLLRFRWVQALTVMNVLLFALPMKMRM